MNLLIIFLFFDLTQFSTLLLKEQFRVSPSKDIVFVFISFICLFVPDFLCLSLSVKQHHDKLKSNFWNVDWKINLLKFQNQKKCIFLLTLTSFAFGLLF